MQRTCVHCGLPFTLREWDLRFLREVAPTFGEKKMDLPPPDLCQHCRMQRRLLNRNERYLYHRKCDLSGKQVISCYSIDKPFPVYENDEWYSDKWDGRTYGREVDFSKPFFDQWGKLRHSVPRLARILEKPYENSDYCNCASQVKNCYLVFSSNQNEDCFYGAWVNQSKNCVDCLNIEKCEQCFEVVGCRECYAVRYSRDCINCSDSIFLRDCQGCRNCFGCTNQVQKQYVVFNRQKTKREYEDFLKQVNTGSNREMRAAREKIDSLLGDPIVKSYHGANIENSSGDYLRNCRNCELCFEGNDLEDCAYCQCLQSAKDSMDHSYWGQGTELVYFTQACGYDCFRILFSNLCWSGCQDLLYCDHCFSCRNCFGCVGLRNSEHCILNKQYSKQEYEELVPRVMEHMKTTGEWGHYFPPPLSIYAYNETLAAEHEPMGREEVLKRGWLYLDERQEEKYLGPKIEVPDDIDDVSDSICDAILHCERSGKPYKVIPQELRFYHQLRIPLPRLHPNERHADRVKLRNPRKLFTRTCAKCGKDIQTTYSPDRPEIVYCERCYLATVY
jgi:hypothetical protein